MKHLFRGPALRVSQPIGDFWVAVIPARILLLASAPDRLRVVVDEGDPTSLTEWKQGKAMLGSQRGLNDQKLKEVGAYVDALDATFPNAIIISANSDLATASQEETKDAASAKTNEKQDWFIDYDEDDQEEKHPHLVIPANPRQAAIVDGQHRLFGFFHSKIETRRDFRLVCAVFFEMPLPLQATVFATINTKQTPVPRAMALNLFGYNVEDEAAEVWSPTKLAVFIARRLNWQEDSPLFGKIKIDAADAPTPSRLPGANRALSLAAVVDGVAHLLSNTASQDANTLKSERTLRRRKRRDLPNDGPLLRAWYLAEADRSIFEVVREFCMAANDVFWKNAPTGSMLVRAVGVRALFSFLLQAGETLGVPASPPNDRQQFVTEFGAHARRALSKASSIDFTDVFFEASGRGQARITNVLLISNGILSIDSLPEGDSNDYRRVLGVALDRS
ncbi:MAG: DGQHR domain-containing protein [Kofleriaceae bacterium]|nr:DGQHR domain-containing protein [Kofleriaceae bacterium]MBP9166381.1 DGQHR domain-containing protein [Kofleriaceae bacterium]MBP9858622.1 DGQHR domain-containing protein [Kofleriaceae bacterium]